MPELTDIVKHLRNDLHIQYTNRTPCCLLYYSYGIILYIQFTLLTSFPTCFSPFKGMLYEGYTTPPCTNNHDTGSLTVHCRKGPEQYRNVYNLMCILVFQWRFRIVLCGQCSVHLAWFPFYYINPGNEWPQKEVISFGLGIKTCWVIE